MVDDGLTRDPDEVVAGLHDGGRVREGLEVPHQIAGICVVDKDPREFMRVRRGQRVADLAGKLDERLGAKSPVEVIVKDDLGKSANLVRGEGHATSVRPHRPRRLRRVTLPTAPGPDMRGRRRAPRP